MNPFHARVTAAAMEVIESFGTLRLFTFERVVFEFARLGTVVRVKTNRKHQGLFETLPEGAIHYRDYRFEWTRVEFEGRVWEFAGCYGYTAQFSPFAAHAAYLDPALLHTEPFGPADERQGPSSQKMEVLSR